MLPTDIRFAFRNLRKNPLFTAFAVLTIAVGLGANTAIFSFLDGVLLRPVAYPEPERLVQVWEKPPDFDRNSVSAANFLDWQKQNTVFESIAALTGGSLTLLGDGEPRQLRARQVTAPYFDILGVRPLKGRTFVRGEDQEGNDHVVVISHRTWISVFGGRENVLNSDVVLNGSAYRVIGIMPPATEFDRTWADIWVPLAFKPEAITRNFHYLNTMGRLKRGVTVEQAQAEMSAIAAGIAERFPDLKKGWGVTVDRWMDRMVGPQLRLSLIVLMTAVGAVLLIGCVNLANLLLAKGTLRSREMAVRTALGASRLRLIRQMITESLILSGIGALAGLILGYAAFRAIEMLLPPFYLPAQAEVGINLRVMGFLTALTIVTGVLFGLLPAWQGSRRDPVEALKEGTRGSTAGGRLWIRNSLVVVEVALAFVLLAGAGLLIKSLNRLTSVDAGFDTTSVVTMGLPLRMGEDTDGARLTAYVHELVQAARSVPGVKEAAFTTAVPLRGWGFGMPFRIAGKHYEPSKRPACFFKMVTPGYFGTLGIRILKGRGLDERDIKGAQPVALVNETFAKRFLKDEDPIGRQVLIEEIITGKRELGPEIPWQVVGIVADEKVNGLDSTSAGVYVSYAQSPVVGIDLIAKGAGDATLLIKSLQRAVWQVNKSQALTEPRTLEEIKSESLGGNRLRTWLLSVFAGLALLLAAIGIYGVLAYVTAQRTQELGVRAALGASTGQLIRLVIGGGIVPVVAGLAIGAVGSYWLTRLLQSLLFETNPTDPGTLVAAAATLLGVALAACYIPAYRASRVDPIQALRYE